MKEHIFLQLFLILTCSFSSSIHGENSSPKDHKLGWNSKELVTLYFHNSELQTQWAWEALSKYRFKGHEKILDFGSGTGKLSALMSFMVPEGEVTGIDISDDMVFYSKKMFPKEHYHNLKFLLSPDIDFENFSENKFDLVTSFCVFHLIPNPSVVLQNLKKAMSPNGHLVITLPIGRNAEFFKQYLKKCTRGD
ncbi:unnamed protein product [marine sediment metagenome]|uniref:Methyltransferase domain-containing protein n=1 Tax=marine sediment metagenome TaxID=412755 RepID=X1DIQ0_9ZZZZ